MSNGPYGQLGCRCGAVSLLVCGPPLGRGRDARDVPATFWPLDAIQIGQGADDVAVSPDDRGGASWRCRQCDALLLYAHDEAGVAVLAGEQEDESPPAPTLTAVRQHWLEELGYRVETLS